MRLNGIKEVCDLDGNHIAKYNGTKKIQRAVDIMKRKTYNNVLKAAKLIQAKGYSEKESLEIAVQKFDELASLKNGMSVEWLIDRMATKIEREDESMKLL